MKTISIRVILAMTMLCIAMFQNAAASSVIVNSSFEEPLLDGTLPGWPTLFGAAALGTNTTISTDYAYEGMKSLRLNDESSKTSVGLRSALCRQWPE